MQYKYFFNLFRILLSAIDMFYGAIVASLIYENKIGINANYVIFVVIAFLGGIILAFTSSEDMGKFFKRKPITFLDAIKQIVFAVLWLVGLVMGVFILIILLYAILISLFR